MPEYLKLLPFAVPPDRALVHNTVRPTRRLTSRGFRAWLEAPGQGNREVCDCGWAPELGQHHTVVRAMDRVLGGR